MTPREKIAPERGQIIGSADIPAQPSEAAIEAALEAQNEMRSADGATRIIAMGQDNCVLRAMLKAAYAAEARLAAGKPGRRARAVLGHGSESK